MTLHTPAGAAVLAATATGPALADTFICTLAEDCETGEACTTLTPPTTAWLRTADDGRLGYEMGGHTTPLDEIARFDGSTAFAGSPSPNNTVLLTLHTDDTMALTVHYTSPNAVFANTLRGTCLMETR